MDRHHKFCAADPLAVLCLNSDGLGRVGWELYCLQGAVQDVNTTVYGTQTTEGLNGSLVEKWALSR